jgi:hypothetical protein
MTRVFHVQTAASEAKALSEVVAQFVIVGRGELFEPAGVPAGALGVRAGNPRAVELLQAGCFVEVVRGACRVLVGEPGRVLKRLGQALEQQRQALPGGGELTGIAGRVGIGDESKVGAPRA